jgi:hypothetical protein
LTLTFTCRDITKSIEVKLKALFWGIRYE